MTEYRKPEYGNEYGPCAICGKTAMPMYGEFLCTEHGSLKYVKRAKEKREAHE